MSDVYVAGVGMTAFGRFPAATPAELGRTAIDEALRDAGLEASEVQLACVGHAYPGGARSLVHPAGVEAYAAAGVPGAAATPLDATTSIGSTALREMWVAVGVGLCDVALVLGIEDPVAAAECGPYDAATGLPAAGPLIALLATSAREYLDRTGVDPAVLAQVAVKNRRHATRNPDAHLRDPITTRGVLGSELLADPLTRFSCAPISQGAAAVVLVSDTVARRIGRDRLVRVRSSSIAIGPQLADDVSHNTLVRRAGLAAFEQAGIEPAQLDVAEVHDATTISEILLYEDLGFCSRWEGATLVQAGETSIGGRLPVSPSGGLLARGHVPGGSDVAQTVEIVRQLRGEATGRQVDGARLGLAQGAGGSVTDAAALAVVHIFEAVS